MLVWPETRTTFAKQSGHPSKGLIYYELREQKNKKDPVLIPYLRLKDQFKHNKQNDVDYYVTKEQFRTSIEYEVEKYDIAARQLVDVSNWATSTVTNATYVQGVTYFTIAALLTWYGSGGARGGARGGSVGGGGIGGVSFA